MKYLILVIPFLFVGCASEGGPNTVGAHGKDSTLSKNKLEGLYLFKIDTQNNVINIHSGGDVEIGL